MDKNQILEQLKQINYPGFNRDVVSFGMVKEVVIDKNIVTIILMPKKEIKTNLVAIEQIPSSFCKLYHKI